ARHLRHLGAVEAGHVVVHEQPAPRAVVVDDVAEPGRTVRHRLLRDGRLGEYTPPFEHMPTPEADYYRLRTEWLRFKSQLFDGLTGLPALPAVIEDVRRIVESRGAAEVVYLDLGRSGGQELKLGWAAYDEAVREFAGLLLALRDTGPLAPHDIVCLHTVRSDRFLVFLAGGDGDALAARRRAIDQSPEDSPLRTFRLASGHARIVNDPVVRSERAILQAVSGAMLMSLLEREGIEAVRRDELSRLIALGEVRAVFH